MYKMCTFLFCVQDLTPENIQRAAEELVEGVYGRLHNSGHLSPAPYSGGKPDDITVILAAVAGD